jgi:hypothetical protein
MEKSSSQGTGKPPAGKQPASGSPGSSKASSKQLRIAAGVAAAVIVVIVLILLLAGGGGSSSTTTEASSAPAEGGGKAELVAAPELLGAMKGVGYAVYWAGPRLGVGYEVLRLPDERTYVRYLPKGEPIESKNPFLTVGSYRQPGAFKHIQQLGEKGGILVKVAGGGSAYAEGPSSTSAYVAFPGVDTQIEVYDPHGGQALKLIRSGAIVPVG